MQGYVLTVEHMISAPPAAIFDVLADAAKHTLIDGSGMLQGAKDQEPERLVLGSKFGMGMKLGVRYSTVNKVVEFEDNRLIAWQTGPEGFAGRLMGGRIWRYQLDPVPEGTLVRESWDITPDPMRVLLKLGDIYANKTKRDMERTLGRLSELMAGGMPTKTD
jgi:Polyketide cyclase / dehydrase and lipid transport